MLDQIFFILPQKPYQEKGEEQTNNQKEEG
jgi:hypothetical protein